MFFTQISEHFHGHQPNQNKMYVRRGKAVTEALGQYKLPEYFLEWGYY